MRSHRSWSKTSQTPNKAERHRSAAASRGRHRCKPQGNPVSRGRLLQHIIRRLRRPFGSPIAAHFFRFNSAVFPFSSSRSTISVSVSFLIVNVCFSSLPSIFSTTLTLSPSTE